MNKVGKNMFIYYTILFPPYPLLFYDQHLFSNYVVPWQRTGSQLVYL
jgi:hypothetical protein